MLLQNEFEIDADLERTWSLLTDLEQVMPCMPGATLEGREGENYLGAVKIKVGPIGAHFRGTAHFAHQDDAAHSAVIAAAGTDPKGQATASAQIQARLEPVTGTRTRVVIDTDLDITGRMAQFGRGAIADVSNRLMGQFAANLGELLSAPGTAAEQATDLPSVPRPAASRPAAAPLRPAAGGDEAGMDVLALVLPMVRERYGQAIAGGLIGFVLSWLAFGRKRGTR
ncbi:SRPBCC family protein [Nocardioides sp. LHD-245]|uniref:SRPBCC family protein n=1 Tax=Nocardioides sp. LHD-245 TaxID=3051387 RepID=UPI0027E1ECD2|nr:SRPBCC family protein [Nocardioides sp. LHD-245]